MSALPPDLRARVLEAARREPSPTAGAARGRVRLTAAVAAFVSLGVFAALGGMHLNRAGLVVAVTGVGVAAAALAATWGAVARGRSMIGRPRAALVAIAIGAPAAVLAWSVAATMLEPTGARLAAGESAAQHLVCFALTALYAFAPFVAALVVRRGSDPVHPRPLGAALGAAAGAWGGLLIDIHCPNDSVTHLALGHAAPIVLLALVGAAIGARVLGLRAR